MPSVDLTAQTAYVQCTVMVVGEHDDQPLRAAHNACGRWTILAIWLCSLAATIHAQESPEPTEVPEPATTADEAEAADVTEATDTPEPATTAEEVEPSEALPQAIDLRTQRELDHHALSAAPERGDSLAGDPWGDVPGGVQVGPLSLRVLLQTRYRSTFADPSDNARPSFAVREDILIHRGDGWRLQRAFMRFSIEPSESLRFRTILDFAELAAGNTAATVKQAYVTWRALPAHLELTFGIFKLPFSIIELDPIRAYELTDVGLANDLTKRLGFGGRDAGAQVMFAPLKKPRHLRVWLGAYRGNAYDENASPLGTFGGRVESKPLKSLRFGLDAVVQPFDASYLRPFNTSNRDVNPNAPDPLYPAQRDFSSGYAVSADVTFEKKGFMLRGEAMLGTRVDVVTRGNARSFGAVWGLVAYRFRTGDLRWLPALRAEWIDADRENPGGRRQLYTVGINCLITKTARLVLDVTRTLVEPGSPAFYQPRQLTDPLYMELPSTRVTLQAQVEM